MNYQIIILCTTLLILFIGFIYLLKVIEGISLEVEDNKNKLSSEIIIIHEHLRKINKRAKLLKMKVLDKGYPKDKTQ